LHEKDTGQLFDKKVIRQISYITGNQPGLVNGLGRSDLPVNLRGHEYVVEFKIYRNPAQFERGKSQLAYYCKSLDIAAGIYLVFVPNTVKLPLIKEDVAAIAAVTIKTFIVYYDEEKDF
jgi:hypothetical protein